MSPAPVRPMQESAPPALRLSGITKRFGETVANDDVSVELRPGEVLALLGENGAGKSTLMGVLFGLYPPDAGTVEVHGKALPPGRPRAAIEAGVGMVHQHFSLASNLSVLENVMTGREPLWRLRSRPGAARARLREVAERFGLAVDPDRRVGDISVGERQRVELLKALYHGARILVLDEPTAVLTPTEAEGLFRTLREMAREGLSLIFISHKLGEVLAAADRIAVLRQGRVVAERTPGATDKAELAELMVGRSVARPAAVATTPGPVVLSARGATVVEEGAAKLSELDFEVRAGEVLGIVGVSGNGQEALGRLVSGLATAQSGAMTLFGAPFPQGRVRALVAAGVARIPEDRDTDGVIADLTVRENAVLEHAWQRPFTRHGFLQRRAAQEFAASIIENFDVRGGAAGQRAGQLSGGNVQKLILGRNLMRTPRLVIAAQPTRGLDEGALAAVHTRLLAARGEGAGILLISEDTDEIVQLADRVHAIVGGRLSAPVPAAGLSSRQLGLMMSGEWTGMAEPALAV